MTLPLPSLACNTTSTKGSLIGASLLNTNTARPLGILRTLARIPLAVVLYSSPFWA